MKQFNLFLASCFLLLPILASSQDTFLEKWADHKDLVGASSSFYFVDAQSMKKIASFQDDKLLNPASTLKLVSGFTFLDKFGSKYTFQTDIKKRGKMLSDGTLDGDVIIYGNGDPSLGSKRYGKSIKGVAQEITNSIKSNGITCIDGALIVDASYYGTDATPPSWNWNDLGNYYAAGTWSVNIGENRYEMFIPRSGRVGASIKSASTNLNIPYFSIVNELTLGGPKSGDQAYIYCAPYQYTAFVRGSIPQGKGRFKIHGSIPNPPFLLAREVELALEKIGIKCSDVRVSYDQQKSGEPFLTINSPSSKKLVSSAVKESINLYCESFINHLGKGNREVGIEAVYDYVKEKNIYKNPIHLEDGSGLSQRNLVSSKMLARFLLYQYKNRPKSVKKILAKSGYEGTLKRSFINNGLKGRVFGKSGSMGGVRAYTGILVAKSGKEIIFSVIVNNYTTSNWKIYQHIDRLLAHMYKNN